MHRYNKPLMIGNQIYEGHLPVKGEWDFRNGTLRVMFGPVRDAEDALYVATRRGDKLLAPHIVATLELQSSETEPALDAVFSALCKALEILEQGTAHRFEALIYESGEDEHSLAGKFEETDKSIKIQIQQEKA